MAGTRPGRHYLAVAAIFRDEARYLAEWIAFHRSVGVEHFFLYDNSSRDDSAGVLGRWLAEGVVTVTGWDVPYRPRGQGSAYAHCLGTFGHRARWLAFIDIDEFLFSPEREGLAAVLADYEGHPGVVVNWQVYGSSGFDGRPDGLVTESFVTRARTQWVRNRRVKSIVDPARTLRPVGPHFFEYRAGASAVTENHEPVRVVDVGRWKRRLRRLAGGAPFLPLDPYSTRESSVTRVSVDRLRINHYITKSREEFEAKFKGRPLTGRERRSHFFYHDRNEVYDPVLRARAPALRACLES